MRTSPSFEMTLQHFGVWRAGVGLLIGLSAAATVAWWRTTPPPVSVLQAVAVLVSILAVTAATIVVLSTPAARLRWDGQRWFCGAATVDRPELAPTELTVAVDLGGWMLLRLQRNGDASWRSRTLWLPAQRWGHEAHWHALRCAVYSPRPASGGPSAADP